MTPRCRQSSCAARGGRSFVVTSPVTIRALKANRRGGLGRGHGAWRRPFSWSEAELQRAAVAADHGVRHRQVGAARAEHGPDRTLGEGAETGVAHPPGILRPICASRATPSPSMVTTSMACIFSRSSAPGSLVQHSRTFSPMAPRWSADSLSVSVPLGLPPLRRPRRGWRARSAAGSAAAARAAAPSCCSARGCPAPRSSSGSAGWSGSAALAVPEPAAAVGPRRRRLATGGGGRRHGPRRWRGRR